MHKVHDQSLNIIMSLCHISEMLGNVYFNFGLFKKIYIGTLGLLHLIIRLNP